MNRALFLDRDGVVNIEKNYLYRIEDFEFTDGIIELCRYFSDRGYLIVIVTNQAGIARGYYSEKDFIILTEWMVAEFEKAGIEIASVKHCPHHPDYTGECSCRKPEPGMLISAAEELDIDLSASVFIGDKISDMEAGKRAGVGVNCLIERDRVGNILDMMGISR